MLTFGKANTLKRAVRRCGLSAWEALAIGNRFNARSLEAYPAAV
jgi:hypothetical protein